jgi:hypothetical protein
VVLVLAPVVEVEMAEFRQRLLVVLRRERHLRVAGRGVPGALGEG